MTMVTVRVHPVHSMNADWAPGGRQPSDQANRLGMWVRMFVMSALFDVCTVQYHLIQSLIAGGYYWLL